MTRNGITSGLFMLFFIFSVKPDVIAQTPKDSDPFSFVVPFHLIARLIMVEAVVEDKKGLFIIDTGSKELVLNAARFQRRTGDNSINDIGGHAVKIKTGYFSFSMGQIHLKNKRAFLTDLSHLERNRNKNILGVIGYSILQDYEVMIDYTTKELTFFHLDKKGNRLSNSSSYSEPTHIIPVKLRGHFPCVEIMIGKEQFCIALDTGAGLNVMDTKTREKIALNFSDSREVNVTSFGKQPTRSTAMLVEGAQLADITFPSMRTFFKSLDQLNDHITGRRIDGLFGFEFLYPYKTALNFRKEEFSIWNGYVKERIIATKRVEE